MSSTPGQRPTQDSRWLIEPMGASHGGAAVPSDGTAHDEVLTAAVLRDLEDRLRELHDQPQTPQAMEMKACDTLKACGGFGGGCQGIESCGTYGD